MENDPVWDLLSLDARLRPVVPSPWFATRVAAKALATPQKGPLRAPLLLRWLIPIPLVCSVLLALAAWSHSRETEAEFERHMEFLASSDYDYGA